MSMTLGDLIKHSGIEGTIDFAIPQAFADSCEDLGIESRQFVWLYEEGSILGKPLNIATLMSEILDKIGGKIESEFLSDVKADQRVVDMRRMLYDIYDLVN